MSFKHIRIEFSIDIEDHKRDVKYQEQKAIESLEMAIKHIKKNGLHRTVSFDDDGIVNLWLNAYRRSYAYCTSTYKSLKHPAGVINSTSRENRLKFKELNEK